MSTVVMNVLLSVVSVVLTALASWGVAVLTNWLNTKIKDKNMAAMITQCLNIVADAVKQIYQEFVEALKKEGKFDAVAQEEAKKRAIAVVKNQLTPELMDFVKANYGDVEAWIKNQIEVALYNLKNIKCAK